MAKRTCSVEGCDKPVEARGWCKAHYNRWRRNGTTELPLKAQCSVPGCERVVSARGWCITHYDRWRRTGTTTPNPDRSRWIVVPALEPRPYSFEDPALPPRIWSRLRVTEDGCWEWTGRTRGDDGYGQTMCDYQLWQVHRLVYTVFTGAIPAGMDMDHYLYPDDGCIGPSCALHTRPVARRENNLRSGCVSAINLAKTHCLRGHPLSGDNVYIMKNGGRDCRACARVRRAARKQRRRSTS